VQQTALFPKPFADVSLNVTVPDWNLDCYKLHTFAVNATFVIFFYKHRVIIMIGDILSPSCTFSFKQTFFQKLYTFIQFRCHIS